MQVVCSAFVFGGCLTLMWREAWDFQVVSLGLPKALSSLSSISFCFSGLFGGGFLCISVAGREILSLYRILGDGLFRALVMLRVSSLTGSTSKRWKRFVVWRVFALVPSVNVLLGRMVCHWVVAVGRVWIILFASFFLWVRSSWICCIMVRVSVVFLMRRATSALID